MGTEFQLADEVGSLESPKTVEELPVFLKKYQDDRHPNTYWVDEDQDVDLVIRFFTQNSEMKFGLEVGFGRKVANLAEIDPTLFWIGTEKDASSFTSAKQAAPTSADQAGLQTNPAPTMIFLRTDTQELFHQASILVFRNPSTVVDKTALPRASTLALDQRLIVIVDGSYKCQLDIYKNLFAQFGYEVDDYDTQGDTLNPISYTFELTPQSEVK